MISDLESSYKRLRSESDTLTARIAVAEESLEALTTELTDKFHCSTVDEAVALSAKLDAARKQLEKQIEDTLASVLN